ncbi:MAG: SusC/RagA family TonB-linked outer membrane protein [Bacteroidaceae bacterium]|nr:SusC/RagA family TonB-linked outer membrane protein [Bacteroidaceae bacterium]
MKTIKYTLLICLLFISQMASAQITRVSGTISDNIDVLPGVSIQEIDATNRIVNATVTDMNGKFAMPIKSTKNKLKISYIGYATQVLTISKAVVNVKLAEQAKEMKTLDVTAKKMLKTSGLAIPEREVSFVAQGLDAKEFEGLGITSVDEALQGRIAGLDIVANSGDLGAGTQMRLRGASSISTLTSNEPLIVVNGQIATDIDQTDFDLQTANEERFAELLKVNTEDILDIKVLKDASATAIWGNRGANGVIEITTKRGKVGPARITYSGKLTFTHQPEAIKLLNGDQYTMMLKEAYFNPRLSDTDGDIPELNYDYNNFSEAYMYDNNTDWLSLVKQNGLRQNHYISLVGGDKKTQFRVSGGYDHETGTVIKQVLNRLSTRMALDYFVSDRIKIISNFSLTYTDNARNYDGLIGHAYNKMPNLSPYYEYENGVPSDDYYFMLQSAGGSGNRFQGNQRDIPNIVASANLATSSQRNYTLAPELELEYKLLGLDPDHHQLRYNGNVYLNINNDYNDKDYPRELSTVNFLDTHTASSSSSKSFSFTTRHTLTFTPHFNNRDHYVTMMARGELRTGTSNSQNTDAKRLPTGISSPAAGGLISGMSSSYGESKSLAALLTAHYSYKSKYSIDGTIRMDGTTKLGPDKRWNPAYSISGRWNLIDEPFMKWAREKAKVSMLSVRPGWGIVYNLPGGDYLYMNKYSTGKSYLGLVSMNASSMKMTNFTAEKINSFNLGFNIGFFNEQLTMAVELYERKTTDMLMGNAGLSTATGWPSLPYKNVGSMVNKGWEFNVNGNRLLRKGKFYIDCYINFANNYNLIKSMDPNVLESYNPEFDRKNASLLQRVQIDNPFGSIYGFRSKGVYQYNYSTAEMMARTPEGKAQLQANIDNGITYPVAQNAEGKVIYDEKGVPLQMMFCYEEGTSVSKFNGGDAIYEDVNNDGQINELDIVYLGSSLPKLTGGFGITFNYGRWRLSSQFNYRYDIDVFNMGRLNNEAMNSNNNQSQAVNYRWRKEGDVTSIPRALSSALVTNYNTLVSDRFVEDASFIRLNYLQLSYSFDCKKYDFFKKLHITGLRLNASANNLFVLTKYSGVDPEIGYGGYGVSTDSNKTPRSKSYTFSLNVDF